MTTDLSSRVRAASVASTRHWFTTPPLACVAGDYFEVNVSQDSGGNLNFLVSARFACYRVA